MNLQEHLRTMYSVFGGDEVSQLVHDQLTLLTRDSQCPEIRLVMNFGWVPLRRAKLAAKDCSVEQIRPELSSKKWPEVGDVFGTTGRGRGRTEFIDENLLFKDHSLSELPKNFLIGLSLGQFGGFSSLGIYAIFRS